MSPGGPAPNRRFELEGEVRLLMGCCCLAWRRCCDNDLLPDALAAPGVVALQLDSDSILDGVLCSL